MPRYVYQCESCEVIFQAVHSIKEKLTDCEECNLEGTLKRIPSMPLVLTKKESNQKQEAGVLVKEHIENAKEDLERERKELRNQVFEDG